MESRKVEWPVMGEAQLRLTVEWHPRWWSRYEEGKIVNWVGGLPPRRIYQHKRTKKLRVHSDHVLHGTTVSVNTGPMQVLKTRGRLGNLYVGEPA